MDLKKSPTLGSSPSVAAEFSFKDVEDLEVLGDWVISIHRTSTLTYGVELNFSQRGIQIKLERKLDAPYQKYLLTTTSVQMMGLDKIGEGVVIRTSAYFQGQLVLTKGIGRQRDLKVQKSVVLGNQNQYDTA